MTDFENQLRAQLQDTVSDSVGNPDLAAVFESAANAGNDTVSVVDLSRPDQQSNGTYRSYTVLVAAAVLVVVGGLVFALGPGRDNDDTNVGETAIAGLPVEGANAPNEGNSLKLPSILDRPRTAADVMPPEANPGSSLPGPTGDIDVDPSNSRRGVEVDGWIVWVVPSADGRGVCWVVTLRDESGKDPLRAAQCSHLDDPPENGVHVGGMTSADDQTTVSWGIILNRSIVGVWGGITREDVFFHTSTNFPSFRYQPGQATNPSESRFELPSVLFLPRSTNDEPPTSAQATTMPGPNGEIELDLEASRFGIEAHGVKVWLVPSVDRRGVCFYGTTSEDLNTSSCTHLDVQQGLDIVEVGIVQEDGRPTINYGIILNSDVVHVVGATVKDDVFVHPDVSELTYVFMDGTTKTKGTTPTECPVTDPATQQFVPPEPYWAEPPDGLVWIGSPDLFVAADPAGHTPRKSIWWSVNYPGHQAEPEPPITVVYKRLDTDADPVIFEEPGTHIIGGGYGGDLMLNGIEPADTGCWQATATYKGATMSYVYEVE